MNRVYRKLKLLNWLRKLTCSPLGLAALLGGFYMLSDRERDVVSVWIDRSYEVCADVLEKGGPAASKNE